MDVSLVYPHQLFRHHPALRPETPVLLVEEELFFSQYPFHRSKLVMHRASMKCFAHELQQQGYEVVYIDAGDPRSHTKQLCTYLQDRGLTQVHCVDPCDYLLERRLKRYCRRSDLLLHWYESPGFLFTSNYIQSYFQKKPYALAAFYQDQRRRLNILMDGEQPAGGRWSLDADNRLKLPAGSIPPPLPPVSSPWVDEAREYVQKQFPGHPGRVDQFCFAVTPAEAEQALQEFLHARFEWFGPYQDAIAGREHFLFHSVLSSPLNTGLLDPGMVIREACAYAATHQVPLNSLEGFVRQILGWREYVRAVYLREGVRQRTKNFMGFTRRLPMSFYTASTGIDPVDVCIQKVLDTSYAHHIERLMVIGNFMLLCEIDPNDVYRWFMELFIDAYDWVMVPNVYGMSQFADGGLMSTKPYFSASSYIRKMGDFPAGAWCDTWDALFWRFMQVHRPFLAPNPRLSMLFRTLDRMPPEKRQYLINTAEAFLKNLDAGTSSGRLF